MYLINLCIQSDLMLNIREQQNITANEYGDKLLKSV